MTLFSTSALSYYGEDNRIEFHDLKNKNLIKAAHAVAYQVDRPWLRGVTFAKYWKLKNYLLHDVGICSNERFATQPTTRSNCSGVLVAEDILLTMGNCLTKHYCNNDLYYWMFDYHVSTPNKINEKWRSRNFYKCKEIIKQVHNSQSGISYLLIRLKKKVKDRKPIAIDYSDINEQEELTVMGHPQGLPLKIAKKAQAYDYDENHFTTNSDITGETKGSILVNTTTGKLRGFLLGGTKNFTDNIGEGCKRANPEEDDYPLEFALKSKVIKNQF